MSEPVEAAPTGGLDALRAYAQTWSRMPGPTPVTRRAHSGTPGPPHVLAQLRARSWLAMHTDEEDAGQAIADRAIELRAWVAWGLVR